MKFWLEAIRPILFHITHNSDQTFYLTTLEEHVGERVPKDNYDLKSMAQLLML
jgi:hypothetical protein